MLIVTDDRVIVSGNSQTLLSAEKVSEASRYECRTGLLSGFN